MRTVVPSALLKLAILIDAVVTGAVAIKQVALASWLSAALALPRSLILGTGVFLVAYTILLVVMRRSERLAVPLVALIIVGNIGWALACLALIGGDFVSPSALGVAFVALQAVAVLLFAGLQWAGLRRSQPT